MCAFNLSTCMSHNEGWGWNRDGDRGHSCKWTDEHLLSQEHGIEVNVGPLIEDGSTMRKHFDESEKLLILSVHAHEHLCAYKQNLLIQTLSPNGP